MTIRVAMVLVIALLTSCNKDPQSKEVFLPESSMKPPVGDVAATRPDDPQKSKDDIRSPLTDEQFKDALAKSATGATEEMDLSGYGINLLLQVPVEAEVQKTKRGVVVRKGDRFGLLIQLGRASLAGKLAYLSQYEILYESNNLLMAQWTLSDRSGVGFVMASVLGYQDVVVQDLVDGICDRRDCLEMIRSAQSLRPKKNVADDPVAALKQLGAQITERGGEVVEIEFKPSQTTDATLTLLGGLKHIEIVELSKSAVTDNGLGNLAELTSLKELWLSGTNVTDAGLAHLSELANLEVLELAADTSSSTKIRGPGLRHLSSLANLVILDLSGTAIDDDSLVHLKTLSALETLNLDRTKVTGRGLEHLGDLQDLVQVELAESGVTDDGLSGLAGLTGLRELNLRGTKITGAGLKHLGGMKNLRQLDLYGTPLLDDGLQHLQALDKLRSLILNKTRITNRGLAHLSGMSQLTNLTLDETQVGDSGVKIVATLLNLRRLSLQATRVTSAGVSQLKTLRKLEELNLSFCSVDDDAVEALCQLTQIHELKISRTKISYDGAKKLRSALDKARVFHSFER